MSKECDTIGIIQESLKILRSSTSSNCLLPSPQNNTCWECGNIIADRFLTHFKGQLSNHLFCN